MTEVGKFLVGFSPVGEYYNVFFESVRYDDNLTELVYGLGCLIWTLKGKIEVGSFQVNDACGQLFFLVTRK